MNPADMSWLLDPEFLTEEHQASNIAIDEIDEDNPEIKKDILVAATFNKKPCLEYKKFSSFEIIIRVICWMKRFCWNVRNTDKKKRFLTVQEMEEAKT